MVLTSKFSLRCSDLCSRKKPCLRLLQPHIQTAECTNQRKYRLPDYYNPERQNITSFGTTTNSFHIHQSYDFSSSFPSCLYASWHSTQTDCHRNSASRLLQTAYHPHPWPGHTKLSTLSLLQSCKPYTKTLQRVRITQKQPFELEIKRVLQITTIQRGQMQLDSPLLCPISLQA